MATKGHRAWGTVRKRASGRWQASYIEDGRRHTAPVTYSVKLAAEGWLATERRLVESGQWTPPADRERQQQSAGLTLGAYAEGWLDQRDLKPRTREHYRTLAQRHILPSLGGLALAEISADDVRAWHASLGDKTPTQRAHAYGLLRTIMGTALSDGKISANPCMIRGAGSAKRVVTIRPVSIEELARLTEAMPQQYHAMVLLAGWCALRFGELIELRRKDIDLRGGVVRIERGVVRTADGFVVGRPKSEAGVRDVHVPPHLLDALADHLDVGVGSSPDALLFPNATGRHLQPSTFYRHWYKARAAIGRPDLRFHDLRHSGAVLAAATGATLAELMARLGHSTPQAAMRYQHSAQGADRRIAAALSALHGADAVAVEHPQLGDRPADETRAQDLGERTDAGGMR